MAAPRHGLELSDPRLQQSLYAAIGQEAVLTVARSGGESRVQGRLRQVKNGMPVMSVPAGTGPWHQAELYVEIPSVGLVFESDVVRRTEGVLQLSHPRWASLLERRAAQRVPASGEVRFTREGEMNWSTGQLIDMSVQGCRLRLSSSVEAEDRLLLRLPLPGSLQPLALRVRVAWWRYTGAEMEIGCEFLALSLQAETSLTRCFNLPRPQQSVSTGGI